MEMLISFNEHNLEDMRAFWRSSAESQARYPVTLLSDLLIGSESIRSNQIDTKRG